MMMITKPVLYIDVDGTIIAQHNEHLCFDLRPFAMSQLHLLTEHFDCRWLTCVSEERIKWLLRCLYAAHILREFKYCNWGAGHPDGKAGYVLDPRSSADFWWLEDPLCPNEYKALERAGKTDRWVRVSLKGADGFRHALRELFTRVGIKDVLIPGEYSVS
jgi:hypothetical protein